MTTDAPTRQHAPRAPLLGQGLAGALLGGALFALALVQRDALLAGVAVVQLLCVLGVLAVTDAPAPRGAFAIAIAATVAADVTLVADEGRVRYLGAVVALSLVVGLLHQLLRHERSRVTESLADTLLVVTLVTATAGIAAAARQPDGTWPTRVALAAAAAALLAGRLGDLLVGRPAVAVGSTRTWPGLLLALGAGVAAAAAAGQHHLTGRDAALIGLAAAGAAAVGDLVIDLAASELTTDRGDARRVAALRPTGLVVPFALVGPIALAAVRLLTGGE